MGMMGQGLAGDTGAATIAGEWAKQDPEGAMTWARSLEGREDARSELSPRLPRPIRSGLLA